MAARGPEPLGEQCGVNESKDVSVYRTWEMLAVLAVIANLCVVYIHLYYLENYFLKTSFFVNVNNMYSR